MKVEREMIDMSVSDILHKPDRVALAAELGFVAGERETSYRWQKFRQAVGWPWKQRRADAGANDEGSSQEQPGPADQAMGAEGDDEDVSMDDDEEEEEEEEEEEPVAVKKVAEWRIFTVPAVLACVAAKVSWGVSENRSFVLFFWKNDHFTKTGSGQTQGNLQKRRWPFSFSQVHWFIFQQWTPIYMMEELGACKKLFSLPSPS